MPDNNQTQQWQTVQFKGVPALYRRFELKKFDRVCGLIHALIALASEHDHHPDVRFGYDYCEVFWTTHSQGGVSELDHRMAGRTDQCLNWLS